MNDLGMRLVAFAALVGFLGILVVKVGHLDLTALVLATLACCAYDFFLAHRR